MHGDEEAVEWVAVLGRECGEAVEIGRDNQGAGVKPWISMDNS